MAEYELLIDPVASRGSRGGAIPSGKTAPQIIEGVPPENQEVEVELRNPRLMESFRARAIFSSKPAELPGADRLWIVRQDTGRFKVPWAVKIIDRIEAEAGEVKALPRREPSLGQRKGHLLADLLKERERKLSEKKEEK